MPQKTMKIAGLEVVINRNPNPQEDVKPQPKTENRSISDYYQKMQEKDEIRKRALEIVEERSRSPIAMKNTMIDGRAIQTLAGINSSNAWLLYHTFAGNCMYHKARTHAKTAAEWSDLSGIHIKNIYGVFKLLEEHGLIEKNKKGSVYVFKLPFIERFLEDERVIKKAKDLGIM